MTSPHTWVVVFDVLVVLAILLLTLTLLPTIFSKTVQRSPGWYSLMVGALIWASSYTFLFGRQEGSKPPLSLCVIQTVLIYGGPPSVGGALVCHYIEFYIVISSLISGDLHRSRKAWSLWLVIVLWLIFLATATGVLMVIFLGKNLPFVVRSENGFYCHMKNRIPSVISVVMSIRTMITLIALEVWTGYRMYRNWSIFKRFSQKERRIVLTVYIRLIFCRVSAVLASGSAAITIIPAGSTSGHTEIAYPILMMFIAFAFGTQKVSYGLNMTSGTFEMNVSTFYDLLQAWVFWRHQEPHS